MTILLLKLINFFTSKVFFVELKKFSLVFNSVLSIFLKLAGDFFTYIINNKGFYKKNLLQ
jgi:hypothetical protein